MDRISINYHGVITVALSRTMITDQASVITGHSHPYTTYRGENDNAPRDERCLALGLSYRVIMPKLITLIGSRKSKVGLSGRPKHTTPYARARKVGPGLKSGNHSSGRSVDSPESPDWHYRSGSGSKLLNFRPTTRVRGLSW